MKKTISAISVAALLASGSFAIAQDAGAGVDANAGVSVEAPAAEAITGVNASVDTTFEDLASSLSGSAAVDLSAVTEDSQINIVLLSSLSGEATAFDEAFAANADGNTTLHGNVSGNSAITAKLEAEGYTADDVVAITSSADGSVTVYVDDRS